MTVVCPKGHRDKYLIGFCKKNVVVTLVTEIELKITFYKFQ